MEQPDYSDRSSIHDATVLGAMWQHRLMVAICVLVVVGLAAIYGTSRPRSFVAEETLILQLPTEQATVAANATRYVADQLAIFQSPVLANRAAEITSTDQHASDLKQEDFLALLDVVAATDENVLIVRFRASHRAAALSGANAAVSAYEDILRSQAASNSESSLRSVDAALAAVDRQLAELTDKRAATPASASQARAFDDEERTLLDQRAQLLTQRVQTSVDAVLTTGRDSVLFAGTPTTSEVRTNLPRLMAVSLFIGLLAGAGLAYAFTVRRRTFSQPSEVGLLLRSPLLAEIPDFSTKGRLAPLPASNARGSEAAEAFRFVASALGTRPDGQGANAVVIVSASKNAGKTTTVANVGIAAALDGARVLVVDADPTGLTLSALLLPLAEGIDDLPGAGIVRQTTTGETIVQPPSGPAAQAGLQGTSANGSDRGVEQVFDFYPSLRRIELRSGGKLDLLRMDAPTRASNGLRSLAVCKFFEEAKNNYDLVLFDTPPILEMANAAAVAIHVGAALIVAPSRGVVSSVQDLAARLELLDLKPLGYVYNMAPNSTLRESVESFVHQQPHGARRRDVVMRRRKGV